MQMTRSSSNEELILNFLRYGADEEYASRANSLSFAKSVLCSYALPIAKFWRPKEIGGATLFVLERDGLSQTTSAHISRVRTTAARLHVNALPVPDLDMTYNDAHQYALDKLSTIAARWEKSHSNRQLLLYLGQWQEAARLGIRVPPLSSRMHMIAIMEGLLHG